MRPPLIIALVAVSTMALAQRPAQASEPPWCLITKGGDAHCRYNSLDVCLRDRMGGSDFCNPNPRYHGEPRRAKPSARYRR